MNVEKFPDDAGVGVKGQSNLEIARTPRNAFRCSLSSGVTGVKLLAGREGFTAYQILVNSEYRDINGRSEPAGAKVRGREGENPDRRLRSRIAG